ncbi:hypothetical protein M0813_07653 [Anaeramoeba flamelloides]|uniref:Uncharacterized protein n=1 Tax=Anaeramoeba flamelloides TaxID=1746091 RepID=A0ABQ8XAH2_9EUKA|nr:hypothetical protein M0813_07653 [Anaeramoeba flamelloides]
MNGNKNEKSNRSILRFISDPYDHTYSDFDSKVNLSGKSYDELNTSQITGCTNDTENSLTDQNLEMENKKENSPNNCNDTSFTESGSETEEGSLSSENESSNKTEHEDLIYGFYEVNEEKFSPVSSHLRSVNSQVEKSVLLNSPSQKNNNNNNNKSTPKNENMKEMKKHYKQTEKNQTIFKLIVSTLSPTIPRHSTKLNDKSEN